MTPDDDPDLLAWYAAIAANPADGTLRQVFADWLEETGNAMGPVTCPKCDVSPGVRRYATHGGDWVEDDCNECSGTGSVSNGRAELAAGYRALGGLGLYAQECEGVKYFTWFTSGSTHGSPESELPRQVFESLSGGGCFFSVGDSADFKDVWRDYPSRREAEDAAAIAIAIARLPEAGRRKILRDAGVVA